MQNAQFIDDARLEEVNGCGWISVAAKYGWKYGKKVGKKAGKWVWKNKGKVLNGVSIIDIGYNAFKKARSRFK